LTGETITRTLRRLQALVQPVVACIIACIIACSVVACSGGTPDAEQKSWSATLHFTAEQWLDNRVPRSFVRTTCERAKKALPKEASWLEQAVERNDRRAVTAYAETPGR
jgi:hypothetical protein